VLALRGSKSAVCSPSRSNLSHNYADHLGGLCDSLAISCSESMPLVQEMASVWQARKSYAAAHRRCLSREKGNNFKTAVIDPLSKGQSKRPHSPNPKCSHSD
jgi:hypothetical protein